MNGYKPVPVAFDEGAAYYYTARGTHPRWSNRVVAWSRQSSSEVFDAVQGNDKEMHVIPEAGHFDLYDLAPVYQRHLNTSHHSLKRIFVSEKGQEEYIFPAFFFVCRNDIYAVSL